MAVPSWRRVAAGHGGPGLAPVPQAQWPEARAHRVPGAPAVLAAQYCCHGPGGLARPAGLATRAAASSTGA